MAIATLEDYRTALSTQREIVSVNLTTTTTIAGRLYDMWRTSAPQGAVPTAAAVPTNTTLGALGQLNPSSGQLTIVGARWSALNPGVYLICDRVSHTGGLVGNVNTVQNSTSNPTNLPTAALTRSTDGVGVMAAVTIYTQIGTTSSTVTATYTNQAGTGSRVSPTVVIGNTGFREANRAILLPLQEGDTGVRSVQSIQLTGASGTGTAGVIGITLFKPLYAVLVDAASGVLSAGGLLTGNTGGGAPAIPDGACLFPLCISAGLNGMATGALLLDEN
jgi:hypothetical protein